MQKIISQRVSASDQATDLSIKHSLQDIFFKDCAVDIFSSPKIIPNSSDIKNPREKKVSAKRRRNYPIVTRVVAVVRGTEHLVAGVDVCVVALDGSSVLAKQGSEVIAMGGSKVCAGPGSRVTAMHGAQVFARRGSTVLMHFGAEIHRQFGATVETVHLPEVKEKPSCINKVG